MGGFKFCPRGGEERLRPAMNSLEQDMSQVLFSVIQL